MSSKKYSSKKHPKVGFGTNLGFMKFLDEVLDDSRFYLDFVKSALLPNQKFWPISELRPPMRKLFSRGGVIYI